jgi:hypothetical protein
MFCQKDPGYFKGTYKNGQHIDVIVCVHTARSDVAIERRNDVTILFERGMVRVRSCSEYENIKRNDKFKPCKEVLKIILGNCEINH